MKLVTGGNWLFLKSAFEANLREIKKGSKNQYDTILTKD